MDPIVGAALVGTGQRPAGEAPTTPEIDALLAGQPAGQDERALLLRAGTWAVYKLAGATAAEGVAAPSPAPEERLPPCSPAAAELLARLLGGQCAELLPEACERLRRAGLRLPFELLPAALGVRDTTQRATLAPVLGERGRWLARFNKAWSWVAETLDGDALPADAETIWQEGTTGQRVEVLRRLRAVAPAKAREWLAAVWKQEKADVRADLLAALEAGLSGEDEALLEAALDDRAERVRAVARDLLARLPDSAFVARMAGRADAALAYLEGELVVSAPRALDEDLTRDGLPPEPPMGGGEVLPWIISVLETVPPSHWEQRFSENPDTLIASVRDDPMRGAVLAGWTKATVRFGESAWASPLYAEWLEVPEERIRRALGRTGISREGYWSALLPLVPSAQRDALIRKALGDPFPGYGGLDALLDALPAPWSDAVGARYLARLRTFASKLSATSDSLHPWNVTLGVAARALPPSCFAAALEPIETPESATNWHLPQFRRQFDAFAETVGVRRRLMEVIPL